jgi:DNA anti-recombination protein RmuC
MPAKTHGERLDRLDEVVGILAESHLSLENLVAELATETRRGFDQVAAQFVAATKRMDENEARTQARFQEMARENAQRSRETDERMQAMARENGQRSRELDDRILAMTRENTQRSRESDERVATLVSAIGELIRSQNPPAA